MGEKSKKSRKKVEKNSQRNFIKQGGGSKAVYKLYKKTGKMVRVGFPKHIHSPCRKENSVNIFNMVGLHRQEDCMRHCQKLGNGRSTPFGTPQQSLSMQSEIEAIASESDDTDDMLTHMWLSVTEGDLGGRLARLPHWPTTEFIEGHGNVPLVAEEDVWRDYYTGERVEFQLPERAYNVSVSGKEYNCLAAVAEEIGFTSAPFAEFDCLQRHTTVQRKSG